MNLKNIKSEMNTVTRNLADFEKGTGSIYESVVILSKRANQLSATIKAELDSKLSDFITVSDNLEEIFENKEQIEVSRYYERLPKPTLISAQEFLDGKIYFRKPEVKDKKSK